MNFIIGVNCGVLIGVVVRDEVINKLFKNMTTVSQLFLTFYYLLVKFLLGCLKQFDLRTIQG